MATIIDLLRHGEPEGGPKYRGSLDDPLSHEGWRQMHAAVQGHPPWDTIISSPLQRCFAFAEALGQPLEIPVRRENSLQEMNFGRWEGKTAKEIMEEDHDRLVQFWHNPVDNPPPGGEPLPHFRQRVESVWLNIVENNQDRTLLVVAHGGIIRMILCLVLHIPLQNISRIVVEYASLSRVRIDRVEGKVTPRLVFHAGKF